MNTGDMNYIDHLDLYPIFKSWETVESTEKIAFSFLLKDDEDYHIGQLSYENDMDTIIVHVNPGSGVKRMVTEEYLYTRNGSSKGVSVKIVRAGEDILRSFSFNYTKVDTPIILNAFHVSPTNTGEHIAYVDVAVWIPQAQRDRFNPVVTETYDPTLPETDIIDIDFKDDNPNGQYVLLGIPTDGKKWITYPTTKPKVAVKKGNTQPGASKPYHTPWS